MAEVDPDQQMLVSNIRTLIGMHDIQQQDLGAFVGISKQGIWQMATGRLRPSLKSARKIAAAFGVSTDELFMPTEELVLAAARAYPTAPIREMAESKRVLQPV